MLRRTLRHFAWLIVLLPGGWYAWQWRSMPHASEFHDDGLYYVSAKSIAETGSFNIESLPAQPSQTKYPPMFPAVLSIAWLLEPHYPNNLPYAMFLAWMWLPLSVIAYRRWLHLTGLSPNTVLVLGVAWAVNPYVVYFSTVMLSEMQFTFFLLTALLCLSPSGQRSNPIYWAGLAGVVAGVAFLTRTAGIAILPAALLFYGIRRQWKHMALFAAAMLPSILGWAIWSSRHRAPGSDPVSLYYTNYFGYFLSSFQWKEAPLYIWKNVDGMVHGLGALLLPDTTYSVLDKVLAESLAIAGIIGVLRLVRANRESIYVPYAAFAACYLSMLAVWNFPPNERFMLPVAPLWLVGFYSEMRRVAMNIAAVFNKPEMGQKIAGGLIGGLFAILMLYCGVRQWTLLTDGLPRFYGEHVERLKKSEPVIAWIRENLPLDARFVAENDPLLYLRTGRRGAGLFPPTIYWYRDDHAARTAAYVDAPSYGRAQSLNYLLLNDWDWSGDMAPADHAKLIRQLREDRRLETLFESGPSAVYRIR